MKAEEDYIFYHHNNEFELNKTKKNFRLTMMPIISEEENTFYGNNKPKKFFFSNTIKSTSLKKKFKTNINNITPDLTKLPPLLIDKKEKEKSSFERRKNYKISLSETKTKKFYTKPENEGLKLVTSLLNKSSENKKDNKKKEKKYFLFNYFLEQSEKRRIRLNNILEKINETEDRYNKENPELDTKLKTNEKIIRDNMWKNSFYLDEYQQFFTKNLKGKISSMNLRQMLKKFRDISLQCFAPGNNHIIPKKINYIE